MKKDLEIPEVKDVFIACVREENEDFRTRDWNVYLLNNNNFPLETVLIVSRGFSDAKQTSTLRHSLTVLPPKSFAKIEFLSEEVLSLKNEFSVSFFNNNRMMHRKFIFLENTISESNQKEIPLMNKRGVPAE